MIPIITLIISFIFDGLLTNYLPYLVQDLSYFTPLFTVTSIFIIYPFYRKNERSYYITLFVLGFLYDLFYTNLLFFNASIFVMIGFISIILQKTFNLGFIKNIIFVVFIISLYEGIGCFFLWLYHIVPITIPSIIYKISHSLLLNIIYVEVVYFVYQIIPKKYKKISLN